MPSDHSRARPDSGARSESAGRPDTKDSPPTLRDLATADLDTIAAALGASYFGLSCRFRGSSGGLLVG